MTGKLFLTDFGEDCESRGLIPIGSLDECMANIRFIQVYYPEVRRITKVETADYYPKGCFVYVYGTVNGYFNLHRSQMRQSRCWLTSSQAIISCPVVCLHIHYGFQLDMCSTYLILVKVELICGKIYSIIIIGTRFAVSQYNLPKLENTYFILNGNLTYLITY